MKATEAAIIVKRTEGHHIQHSSGTPNRFVDPCHVRVRAWLVRIVILGRVDRGGGIFADAPAYAAPWRSRLMSSVWILAARLLRYDAFLGRSIRVSFNCEMAICSM